MQEIVDYLQNKKEQNGNTISAWIEATNKELEEVHNYIQYCFPTTDLSRFVKEAPQLNQPITLDDDTYYFNMYKRMLKFYGIIRVEVFGYIYLFNNPFKKKHWLQKDNHNHLRLTRIIKSLYLTGFHEDASSLHSYLLNLTYNYPKLFSSTTKYIWNTEL